AITRADGAGRGRPVAPADGGAELARGGAGVGVRERRHHAAEGGALERGERRSRGGERRVGDGGAAVGAGGAAAGVGDRHRDGVGAFFRVSVAAGNVDAARTVRRDGAGRGGAVAPADGGAELARGGAGVGVREGRHHAAEG